MVDLIKVSDYEFININEIRFVDLVGNTLYIFIKGRDNAYEIFDKELKVWNKINEIYERNN